MGTQKLRQTDGIAFVFGYMYSYIVSHRNKTESDNTWNTLVTMLFKKSYLKTNFEAIFLWGVVPCKGEPVRKKLIWNQS